MLFSTIKPSFLLDVTQITATSRRIFTIVCETGGNVNAFDRQFCSAKGS